MVGNGRDGAPGARGQQDLNCSKVGIEQAGEAVQRGFRLDRRRLDFCVKGQNYPLVALIQPASRGAANLRYSPRENLVKK
jgi:hypothetical protein